MDVMQDVGQEHPQRGDTRQAQAPGEGSFDVEGACAFLCAQASWLDLGLRRSEDPSQLATALRAHERGHETWLGLIGAADRVGETGAADRMGALYAFHGRVVGALEGGPDGRVDAVACAEVRRLLCERLDHLTRETLAALRVPRLDVRPAAPALALL